MLKAARPAAASARRIAANIAKLPELLGRHQMTPRRFPPPWTAEVTPNCFIVRDACEGIVSKRLGSIYRLAAITALAQSQKSERASGEARG
jgi:hypothetical protein